MMCFLQWATVIPASLRLRQLKWSFLIQTPGFYMIIQCSMLSALQPLYPRSSVSSTLSTRGKSFVQLLQFYCSKHVTIQHMENHNTVTDLNISVSVVQKRMISPCGWPVSTPSMRMLQFQTSKNFKYYKAKLVKDKGSP